MSFLPSARGAAVIAAICLGPIVALFVVSLAIEDHRNFTYCRLYGFGVDACLLKINGR